MNNVWAGASTKKTTARQRRTGGRTHEDNRGEDSLCSRKSSLPSIPSPFLWLPPSLTSSTPFFPPPPPHYWRGEEDVEGEKEEGRGKSARLFVLHPLSLSFCRSVGRSMIRSRHSGSERASEGTAFKTTTTERETVRPAALPGRGTTRWQSAKRRTHARAHSAAPPRPHASKEADGGHYGASGPARVTRPPRPGRSRRVPPARRGGTDGAAEAIDRRGAAAVHSPSVRRKRRGEERGSCAI